MNKIDTPVCVVDDDDSVRESIEGLLRSEEIPVETYRTASEFLARPSGEPPGCLILDVNLPGFSGLDLQRELTRTNVYIPIIFLTGYGDIPMSVRAIKEGALEFLTKPLDPENLLRAIREVILAREYPGSPENGSRPHSDEIVGASSAYRRVLKRIAMVHGTGRLQTDLLEKLAIPLPPLSVQERIAAVLGALDDKIANNAALNHHLSPALATDSSPDIRRGSSASRRAARVRDS